eukprot:m.43979 g.43979  ORF g.43979 m.43979 type:complete len:401 (-) comp10811_c1_seq1:1432-2634(-)
MADEAEAKKRGEATESPFNAFVLSEGLLEKLKLLGYDSDFCVKLDMKPIHRYYFAQVTNSNEQLWYFGCLMAWLLKLCGQKFAAPDQFDDPNTITTSIMAELRKLGIPADFSQTKLKAGAGPEVCQVLNTIAQMALKAKKFSWERPIHLHEDIQEHEEDDGGMEMQAAQDEDEEEILEDDFDEDDGDFIDVDTGGAAGADKGEVLESNVTSAEWKIELERVLPQLKVHIRADVKDWRTHLQQMSDNMATIETAMSSTSSQLSKLEGEIAKTLEKLGSREKYINSQLEGLVSEYRQQQDTLASTTEKYKEASTTVTAYSKQLAELSADLEAVKSETQERGTSMTDATPLVKIKQALTALKKDISQMDLRIGVVQHILLSASVRAKGDIVHSMHKDDTETWA